jgi:hypothetical protein
MAVCSSYLHTLKSQRVTICFLFENYQKTCNAQSKDLLLTIHKHLPNGSARNSTKEKEMSTWTQNGTAGRAMQMQKKGVWAAGLWAPVLASAHYVYIPWADSESCSGVEVGETSLPPSPNHF